MKDGGNRTIARCPGYHRPCGSLIFVGDGFGDLCPPCRKHRRKLERDASIQRERFRRMTPDERGRKLAREAAWKREVRKTDPERIRAYNRKAAAKYRKRIGAVARRRQEQATTFGLAVTEADAMLAAQGGRCGICADEIEFGRGPGHARGAHIDHDHRFDRKDRRGHRGLLCRGCNTRLGLARERRDLLSPAELAYLQAHEARFAELVKL